MSKEQVGVAGLGSGGSGARTEGRGLRLGCQGTEVRSTEDLARSLDPSDGIWGPMRSGARGL